MKLFARYARNPLRTTHSVTESTVPTPAILPPAIMEEPVMMTKDQFKREVTFCATMQCIGQMLKAGMLTQSEYEKCRKMMLQKYNPPVSKIVSN